MMFCAACTGLSFTAGPACGAFYYRRNMTMKAEKQDLRGMTVSELEELCVGLGEQKYRAKQMYSWIYGKRVQCIEEMGNLSGALRARLNEEADIGVLRVLAHQVSEQDGAEKYLFELEDGNAVESVLMRYNYGNSVCVSTQAGCRMGCVFCASGLNGLVRDLTAGEIVSQILDIMRNSSVKVNHVVFMGTGEPFDNYENVAKAIHILTEPLGLGMSARNITVSTCGLVPGIKTFADDFDQVNLAISLHASNDQRRKEIMPVAKSYSLDELIKACDYYTDKTKRRVTFEYALIAGENDSDRDMKELADLLRGHLAHVNLIPLNEVTETGLKSAGRKRAREFRSYLEDHGVPASVRRELGSDIDGACGQLRNKKTVIAADL